MLNAQGRTMEFSCRVSSHNFSAGLQSFISVQSPDGLLTNVPSDKDTTVLIPLTKEGFYDISCSFNSPEFGLDTISRKVLFSDADVLGIKVNLKYDRENSDARSCGSLMIQRILKADSDIKLSYSHYNSGSLYCGPIFTIENNSSNTLYGRYLPGWFWGEYAKIVDGEAMIFKTGTIDTCFTEREPLYPGNTREALIGSFGHMLPPGAYRFNLLYQISPEFFDSYKLLHEDEHHRWLYAMHDGYLISCDFVVLETDYRK